MHSSRMRTVRSGGRLPGRGGVSAFGPGGVYFWSGGGVVSQHALGQTPPVDRQTPVKT